MSVMTRAEDGHKPSPPPAPGNRNTRALRVLATLVVAVVLVVFAVSWTHAPWRDFVHRQAPSYVELTIAAPASLPSSVPSGGSIRFSFVINNVESAHARRTVSWVTSVRDTVTGAVAGAGKGSVVLTGGTTRTVSQDVTIRGAHRSEVIVRLDSGQQVDFFLTPTSP
ncbi:MAG TPA: hypothetical protein VHZ96_19895 [Frankiaceae bacterium]|jgi:hypothetical protein|nr:hypothetical protein [Frankiaceae bacterium]